MPKLLKNAKLSNGLFCILQSKVVIFLQVNFPFCKFDFAFYRYRFILKTCVFVYISLMEGKSFLGD